MDVLPICRALLSVYDKTWIVELAEAIQLQGCKIISTGGTGRALREAGIHYDEVSEYTGSPEMLGGRVKTLHPRIHGGLLFRREDPKQVSEAGRLGIAPIDLVAVNLYPFEATVAKPGVTVEEATENIDIGGPTMIRAAAKNFFSVVVLTDPDDYAIFMKEIEEHGGVILETRRRLAKKAFDHTSKYDAAITKYFSSLEKQG